MLIGNNIIGLKLINIRIFNKFTYIGNCGVIYQIEYR